MTLNELINNISKELSTREDSSEYKSELYRLLNLYNKYLNDIPDSEKHLIFQMNIDENWNILTKDIAKLSKSLKESVREYYKGFTMPCFNKLSNWLKGNGTYNGLLRTSISTYVIPNGCDLYRIRANEKNKYFKPTEMFHIPFEKRGIIKTQRYSVPGYPCLYLSSSIYGCWEEMRKPNLSSFKVSRLCASEEITLLDLRIPSVGNIDQSNYIKILRILPLIIACSIKVINSEHTYKPEYIVSQVVLQIIIKNRINSGINGIIYSSTQRNLDFKFNESNLLDNIAIPVYKNETKGLCSKLSRKFTITPPTCYEHELIRDPEGMVNGHEVNAGNSFSVPNEFIPYSKTAFGLLESRLKEKNTVSLLSE